MRPQLAALILVTALIAPAQASNMRFLEFSPSAFFTEEDWTLLRQAANNLLNEHADGESVTWKNDATGHNGRMTLIDTYSDFGTTCRRMKVFSDAIQVSATRLVNMCKNKQGEWKVLN